VNSRITPVARPLGATLVCAWLAVCLVGLLFHLFPGHPVTREGVTVVPPAALWFRIVTGGVDLAATIGGLVALWQMRPVAPVFFAALLGTGVVEAAEAIFVRHTVQATRIALMGQPGHGGHAPMSAEAAFWTSWMMPVLAISFEAALFVYVWRVTRNRERTDGDVGVRPEPIRQLAARR
jgi:hypothetical protein